MLLKPAPEIVWCPSRLHRCSRYNHRTTFQNDSPRASTSINTRLRSTSFPLKPTPDIVWCPFPLRNTRNQHGLSAITTHLVSIANAYKVYNNGGIKHEFPFIMNDKPIRSLLLHSMKPKQKINVCTLYFVYSLISLNGFY